MHCKCMAGLAYNSSSYGIVHRSLPKWPLATMIKIFKTCSYAGTFLFYFSLSEFVCRPIAGFSTKPSYIIRKLQSCMCITIEIEKEHLIVLLTLGHALNRHQCKCNFLSHSSSSIAKLYKSIIQAACMGVVCYIHKLETA